MSRQISLNPTEHIHLEEVTANIVRSLTSPATGLYNFLTHERKWRISFTFMADTITVEIGSVSADCDWEHNPEKPGGWHQNQVFTSSSQHEHDTFWSFTFLPPGGWGFEKTVLVIYHKMVTLLSLTGKLRFARCRLLHEDASYHRIIELVSGAYDPARHERFA